MSSSQHPRGRHRRISVLAAGACALVACAGTSQAVQLTAAKGFLNWSSWQAIGALGNRAIVAIVEGGLPLPTHHVLDGKISLELSWPWLNSPFPDDPNNIVNRNWYSTHATAVASAIVGNGSLQGIGGLAPNASLIASSFATGIDPLDNSYSDLTLTSLAFALFSVTDQSVADSVADALRVERWKVASVVNASYELPFAVQNQNFEGEDPTSRIFNICASMTGATIICPVGELGSNTILMSHQPQLGTAKPPATAFNVISVGRTTQDFRNVDPDSGGGLVPVIEYAVKARLIPPDADPMGPPPLPTDPELFEKRPGVDIVAPGTNITLAGSLSNPVDDPDPASFSDFWFGTGFSTALVSSAAALVHDIGLRNGLWVTGSPSALVTKAVLINSASKANVTFNNNAQPDQNTNELITTQGLDKNTGAGQLDFKRLLNQFWLADVKDYKNIHGRAYDPETQDYSKVTVGTDPRVPFVQVNTAPLTAGGTSSPGASSHSAGLGAGGVPVTNDNPGGGDPMAVGRVGLNDDDPTLGHGNPGLGGSGSGGVAPAPDPIPFPGGPLPGIPLPPPPTLPTPPTPGAQMFNTGWDSGNIGTGFIDYPIGVVNSGSTVSVTLCWNRRESWVTPNFAGPMSFISPDKVLAPGFVNSIEPPAPINAIVSPRSGLSTIKPRSEKMIMHTIGADGECYAGAGHAVIKKPDGTLMPARQADALVDGYVKRAMSRQFEPAVDAPRPRAGGLDIQFNFGPILQTHPEFISAMQAAATIWESAIQSPIVVTINVELDDLGNNIIGATGSNFMGFDYPTIRQAIVLNASPELTTLVNALPTGSAPFVGDPDFFTTDDSDGVILTSANARAIGLPTSGNLDAFMLFNSSFPFDTNPSDGITPGQVDLVAIMTHELGHALGFDSSVDDEPTDPDSPMHTPTTLDLYRFGIDQAFNKPNTLANFTSFPREYRANTECALNTVDAVFTFDGIADLLRFSTGQYQGDHRQSSHWKDNILLGTPIVIGIMDPTYNGNVFAPGYISAADLLSMAVIGWKTDITRPPSGSPGRVPVISTRSMAPNSTDAPYDFLVSQGGPNTLISNELAFANLDISLNPVSFDGVPLAPIASSRTTDNNVEHIFIAGVLTTTQYVIRVSWVNTRVDVGGYPINDTTISVPRPGYRDLPEAQVEFGLAWYVDQARLPGGAIVNQVAGDLDGDGVVNASDLATLLAAYGSNNPAADLNSDGVVNSTDLALLLGSFNSR